MKDRDTPGDDITRKNERGKCNDSKGLRDLGEMGKGIGPIFRLDCDIFNTVNATISLCDSLTRA